MLKFRRAQLAEPMRAGGKALETEQRNGEGKGVGDRTEKGVGDRENAPPGQRFQHHISSRRRGCAFLNFSNLVKARRRGQAGGIEGSCSEKAKSRQEYAEKMQGKRRENAG